MKKVILLWLLIISTAISAERPQTDTTFLNNFSQRLFDEMSQKRQHDLPIILNSSNPYELNLKEDPSIDFMYFDKHGLPVYYCVNNLMAAQTISTDEVWPGGLEGFSLSGSTTTFGQLGLWDGGGVLSTHIEFGERVTNWDGSYPPHYHATHVAGTMIAAGLDPNAKGMSPEAPLLVRNYTYDTFEMALAASNGMLVSNHSYGVALGWRLSGGIWYWHGDVEISETEEYRFGFYTELVAEWDSIACTAPL